MITEKQFLKSLKYVISKSNFVKINYQVIDRHIRNFSPAKICHWSEIYPIGYRRRNSDDDELDFIFLIGSLAFCFWGYPKKWTVNYEGKKLDGWWALIACFERALDDGLSLLDGEYLANLSLKDTRKIFTGDPEIPLLKERKEILNKIGEKLTKKYNGRFHNFYKKQTKEAFSLIAKIAEEFYGFDDVTLCHGKKVLFYKKAQVVLTDINEIFQGLGYGAIKNIEKLPGHADYKIPAVLRKLGILEYNDELSKMIDNRIIIPSGSEMEIEIRANMLWAIHLMCEKLKPRHPIINPSMLCGILWGESQTRSKVDKPYHLTRTIYY